MPTPPLNDYLGATNERAIGLCWSPVPWRLPVDREPCCTAQAQQQGEQQGWPAFPVHWDASGCADSFSKSALELRPHSFLASHARSHLIKTAVGRNR